MVRLPFISVCTVLVTVIYVDSLAPPKSVGQLTVTPTPPSVPDVESIVPNVALDAVESEPTHNVLMLC